LLRVIERGPPSSLDVEIEEALAKEGLSLEMAKTLLLSPAAAEDLWADLNGEPHEGTGLSIPLYVALSPNAAPSIIAPRRGSPAWRAKLRARDEVTSVDGVDAAALPAWDVGERLRARDERSASLIIRRDGSAPASLKLRAEQLDGVTTQVTSVALSAKSAYHITVPLMRAGTSRALEQSLRQVGEGPVVLDLRDCPGGYVKEALTILGLFIGVRPIALAGAEQLVSHAPQTEPWNGQLIVLVNAGTASAAELVALGLQSQRRARLVGERTYGKGLAYRILPLPSGWLLLVENGLACTSLEGRPLHNSGVFPDVPATSDATLDTATSLISSDRRMR
jgi:carboxyl-terminal processing protease